MRTVAETVRQLRDRRSLRDVRPLRRWQIEEVDATAEHHRRESDRRGTLQSQPRHLGRDHQPHGESTIPLFLGDGRSLNHRSIVNSIGVSFFSLLRDRDSNCRDSTVGVQGGKEFQAGEQIFFSFLHCILPIVR